ncbi:MAG TPA: DUF2071 domain-containing protein [Candidatus Methylacidiphilales bacterium]|jgi:hypothetical protein|nr:DUF2071 domain-containing protein [Candidatus Methylacidiphilales bacterium]
MKIPTLEGLIRRRLLINFRVDQAAMQRLLPAAFRPKLYRGHAIAGLCLIRLEQVRPAGVPPLFGFSSENAAHRVAVEWTTRQGETREGVYIFRRDTDSALAHLAGGRLFPGIHHPAEFRITDEQGEIDFAMTSRAGDADIHLHGTETDALPPTSWFQSLAESSRFFENGSLGYSESKHTARRRVARQRQASLCCPGARSAQEAAEDVRTPVAASCAATEVSVAAPGQQVVRATPCDPPYSDGDFDGLRLETTHWDVRPFAVTHVASHWLAANLPGAEFDHALLMRDIPHRWHNAKGTL